MLVIRCTRSLLKRVGPPTDEAPASTTRLGDWYAKPVSVAQRRYLLLMSSQSLLTVVMPGRDVANLARNFPGALQEVLVTIGVPVAAVEREVAESSEIVIATTDSRSLLASLNDFGTQMKFKLATAREPSLLAVSMYLNNMPVGARGYAIPMEIAQDLLARV